MTTMRELYDREIARMNRAMTFVHSSSSPDSYLTDTSGRRYLLADAMEAYEKIDWSAIVAAAYAGETVTVPVTDPVSGEDYRVKVRRAFADKDSATKGEWVLSKYDRFRQDLGKIVREPISSQQSLPVDSDCCECGSGSNLVGPGHSDWCRRYLCP